MKIEAVLFVTLLLAMASIKDAESKRMTLEQIKNTAKGVRKPCAQKYGPSKELLDNAQNGDFSPDPKLQCYYKCVLTMMKALRNDQLQPNVMIQQTELIFPLDLVDHTKDVISKCVEQVTSSEACEVSWQFVKCVYETDSSKISSMKNEISDGTSKNRNRRSQINRPKRTRRSPCRRRRKTQPCL